MATGDTLYDYLEQELVLTASNTYGCTTSEEVLFFFPGVFDLREVIMTWLSPTTLEVFKGWSVQRFGTCKVARCGHKAPVDRPG